VTEAPAALGLMPSSKPWNGSKPMDEMCGSRFFLKQVRSRFNRPIQIFAKPMIHSGRNNVLNPYVMSVLNMAAAMCDFALSLKKGM
jgi:hypothetical protein